MLKLSYFILKAIKSCLLVPRQRGIRTSMQHACQIRREEAWGLFIVYHFRVKIMNCSTADSIMAVLLVTRTVPGVQWALDTCLKNE